MDNREKNWFVVYTRSRAEKKVSADLAAVDIECYLPLQRQLRRWKNRKKWVEMSLISGYCFVHITRKEYDQVLKIPNVVSYVTFESKAAIIPENQILTMKQMLGQPCLNIEVSHDNFAPGNKVLVMEGPLMGLEGELKEEHGKNRFILRMDAINSVFMADIPGSMIKMIN